MIEVQCNARTIPFLGLVCQSRKVAESEEHEVSKKFQNKTVSKTIIVFN
jgi:hypothetical protein